MPPAAPALVAAKRSAVGDTDVPPEIVSVAALLVTEPAEFDTTQRYWYPVSVAGVVVMVSVAVAVPL